MNPLITDTINTYNSPIIVAIDSSNEKDAYSLISKLDPSLCKLKVGKELFVSHGPQLVEKFVVSGYDVFLDLKFHDIPNTVYKACMAAANLGVWMVNVHASGGEEMLIAAKAAITESKYKPLLTAVTILTSMPEDQIASIGITDGLNMHIKRLAKLAHKCGLDGVVCSALEAKMVKEYTDNSFLTITPGIRLVDSLIDDQSRIMTPIAAINNLADYLVIGRPITQAKDPGMVLQNIYSQIVKR